MLVHVVVVVGLVEAEPVGLAELVGVLGTRQVNCGIAMRSLVVHGFI